MTKISVIVPVYNKATFIKDCLDSLVRQTLEDIEIICVDDKSTDNSLDMLLEYAKTDKRIKILPQEKNCGLSATRNVGMKAATGEFLAFVDADDFIDKEFLEKLYNASDSYDVIKGEIWEYDEKTNKCVISEITNSNAKIKETGNPIHFYDGITSAIYRRDFLTKNNLYFSEDLFYNEDTVFEVEVVTKLSKIKIVDGAKYYYRYVPNSLSRNFTEKVINGFYLSALKTIDILKYSNKSKEDICIVFDHLLTLMGFFLNSGMLAYEQVCHIKREFLDIMKSKSNGSKEDIKVSVIVPIYNGQDYLRRTLSCLTFQSLYEIEIICVNDCSKDSSLSILNEYAKDDSRIKIIDCQVNGGESKARNIGINAAKGEYVAFMDQDDKIDLLFYEKLYKSAKSNNADIAKGNSIEIDYEGRTSTGAVFPVEKNPYYFCSNWWTAIYRRKMIVNNNVRLPEGYKLGGDIKFMFDAASVANKVSLVWNVFYYHITHADSGDSEITPHDKIQSVIAIFDYIINKVEERDFYSTNRDLYSLYYYIYISHIASRIGKCIDVDSKKACINFMFKHYRACKCKDEILKKLYNLNSTVAKVLENDEQEFLERLFIENSLNGVFYEYNQPSIKEIVSYELVIANKDNKIIDEYTSNNVFIKGETEAKLVTLDIANKPLSQIYNSYLDDFDYAKDCWVIFANEGLEFLSFPSNTLSTLDKNKIYGPAGMKAFFDHYKVGFALKGKAYRKNSYLNFSDDFYTKYHNQDVDTLDGVCLIIHSSLIQKHHLRFDENLSFSFAIEDLCIIANQKYNIPIEVTYFDCVLHTVPKHETKNEYTKQIEYLAKKYPDNLYGAIVSPIGGKIMPTMSNSEFSMFKIRYELTNKKKL